MKTGLTLPEMAAELQRQRETKRDFVVDTPAMSFRPADGEGVRLEIEGLDLMPLVLRETAHRQFASGTGIPKPYYDRMKTEAPDLLATNLNHWLADQPKRRLVRTLDGQVRALLSDRYRPLDNFDLAQAVLPKLIELEADVVSTAITEDRFYLKAVSPRITEEVEEGDVVQAGLVVSNSETGQGSLRIEEMDYRLVCLNGMIRAHAVRKAHLGRQNRVDAIESAREFFRDETRELEDRTFWNQVLDATTAMFDRERFRNRIEQYREAKAVPIEQRPVKAVEVLAERYQLNEREQDGVLEHLLRGNDLSQYGLANAVTRASQDVESYQRATELEAVGGQVIELSPVQWQGIRG